MLQKALEMDPRLAKTHFFLGTSSRASGATRRRWRAARGRRAYPRDRVVLNQLGRVLFLQRDFAPRVETFKRVLAIDPEDLQAHYNLMLCYQGSATSRPSSANASCTQRFKADEAAQAITGPYRQLHAHDNNERQQIHEHRPPSP